MYFTLCGNSLGMVPVPQCPSAKRSQDTDFIHTDSRKEHLFISVCEAWKTEHLSVIRYCIIQASVRDGQGHLQTDQPQITDALWEDMHNKIKWLYLLPSSGGPGPVLGQSTGDAGLLMTQSHMDHTQTHTRDQMSCDND